MRNVRWIAAAAALLFNLIAPALDGSGRIDTLGTKSLSLDLVTDAVDTRPDLTSLAGQAFLALFHGTAGR